MSFLLEARLKIYRRRKQMDAKTTQPTPKPHDPNKPKEEPATHRPKDDKEQEQDDERSTEKEPA
jgi:hypothetical protein